MSLFSVSETCDDWCGNMSTTSTAPVHIKVSIEYLIRLLLIAWVRQRLINPSLLFPFWAVCIMTTAGPLKGESTPGYVK